MYIIVESRNKYDGDIVYTSHVTILRKNHPDIGNMIEV